MSREPASYDPYASPGPGQVIGLFLARLIAYLMRLQTNGQTIVPDDIACMVASAEGMVHHVIRAQAAAQLKHAGFTEAARAMRDPEALREARRSAQAAGGADSLVCNCSPAPSLRLERVQGCNPASPAELIDRLQTTIETFDRADALASQLAHMILCALAFVFPETRERPAFARPDNASCRVGFSPPTIIPAGQGPPYFWPPPFWIPGLRPGQLRKLRTVISTAFPERVTERPRIRDPEKQRTRSILIREIHKRLRRRSTTEAKSKNRCEQI